MSRRTGQCAACSHAEAREINEALVRGVPARDLARRFKLPYGIVARHRRDHVPRVLALDKAGKDTVEAAGLRKMLVQIGEDFQKLFEEFMKAKDHRAALIAREKMLAWWTVAAKMLGIDEPPEGQREKQSPEAIAQAARDLYGITEEDMADLDSRQPALPPADAAPEEPEGKAPVPEPEPATPGTPAESMAERYRRTQREIETAKSEGHFEVAHDPNIEEKIRRAVPVPNLLAPPPVPQSVYLGGERSRCPNCAWEGLLSNPKAYEEHWRAAHGKPN